MSTAAKFSNNVEISGNIDISGDININGTLTIDESFNLYGYDIPNPLGENNKVLTISGDGYSWETVQSSGSSGSADDISINAAGQTFFEIITEQPRAFTAETMTNGTLFNNTFNTIDISWNFDQLIPFDTDNQHLNITGDLNQRVLPCITHIYFDISSSEVPNTTIYDSSKFVIAVDANDNYNVDTPSTTQQTWSIGTASLKSTLTYKSLTLTNNNTAALLYKYTVRIWGVNQSNGTEVNKLTYSDLQFLSSGIPATPTIHSVTPSGTDTATLDISLNVPDIDINNDDTEYDAAGGIEIKDVDISCTETETLRSTKYDHGNSFELSEAVTSQRHASESGEDISVNVSFTDISFNLGSKYEIQAKCINALNATDGPNNDGYTSYSSVFQMTDFIDIPTSDGENTDDPFEDDPEVIQPYGNSTKSIKLSSNTRSISLYLLDDLNSDARIRPVRRTTNSIVEITHPDKDKDDTTGYGKFIDNSENIISINCLLMKNGAFDVSLQQVDYHGWNISPSFTSHLKNANITPFTNLNTQDQESNTRAQGFRLQAVYFTDNVSLKIDKLNTYSIISPFDPSTVSNGYQIQYNLVRSDGYDTTNTTNPTRTSGEFYIDSFTNYYNPNYTTNSSIITVTGISWIMGIPQVSTVDISFTRNHININSEYKYFQSNGLIAKMNSIKVNGTNGPRVDGGEEDYLSLDNYSDISTTGSYTGSFNRTLNYSYIDSSQNNNTVSSLFVNTDVYNLYTTNNNDEEFSVLHYRDVTGISGYDTIFDNNIYEISGISVLGSNMQSVHDSLQLYQDATSSTEIKDHSILYIDGLFQLDSRKNNDQYYSYPDICNSFEWNELISSYNNNTYTNKDNRYTPSGTRDDTYGYRWLVYKVDESSSTVEFVDAGNNSAGTAGINLSYIMNKLFGSTIETEFYNSLSDSNYDDDILVYIVCTNKSSGTHFLGRIIQDSPGFDTSNKWYSSNNITSAKSLENMASGDSCGALPGSSLQDSIRDNITNSTLSNYFTDSTTYGHSPIAIYTDSDAVENHYFYFAIR